MKSVRSPNKQNPWSDEQLFWEEFDKKLLKSDQILSEVALLENF